MLKKNAEIILEKLSPDDIVLDIGGWAQPFNRANYVLDIMPYETRGFFGNLGPEKEFFSKTTWIRHDISSKTPLPFGDKEIDFVICSHTLEDIRDPVHLCSEIIRIGKKGYIEVPSRIVESTKGLEGKKYVGYYHHRWLVDIGPSELTFRFKTQLLNKSWQYRVPKSYLKKVPPDLQVSWMFWEDFFDYKEIIQISELLVAEELKDFIKSKNIYPRFYYSVGDIVHNVNRSASRLIKHILARSVLLRTYIEKKRGRPLHLGDTESFWQDIQEIHSK